VASRKHHHPWADRCSPAGPSFSVLEEHTVNNTTPDQLTDNIRQLERQQRQLRRDLRQTRKAARFYEDQLNQTRQIITRRSRVSS
jgi:hypothetical protein